MKFCFRIEKWREIQIQQHIILNVIFDKKFQKSSNTFLKVCSATKGIPNEWDENVFNELPGEIKMELLAQNHTPKSHPKPVITQSNMNNSDNVEVPSGWDGEVFQSLPDDIKNELLANRKSKQQPQPKPQNRKNSILKYFQKKQR